MPRTVLRERFPSAFEGIICDGTLEPVVQKLAKNPVKDAWFAGFCIEIAVVSTVTEIGTRDWVQVPDLEISGKPKALGMVGAAEAAVAKVMLARSVEESNIIIEYIEGANDGCSKSLREERTRGGGCRPRLAWHCIYTETR